LWHLFLDALPPSDDGPQSSAEPGVNPRVATALQACAKSAPKKAVTAWAQLSATVAQLEADPVRGRPASMIQLIIDAGFDEYLEENYPNYRNRLEDIEQLANFAFQFKSTEEFLTQLALLSNLEAEDDKPAADDSEQIRLSTI